MWLSGGLRGPTPPHFTLLTPLFSQRACLHTGCREQSAAEPAVGAAGEGGQGVCSRQEVDEKRAKGEQLLLVQLCQENVQALKFLE